MRYVILHCPNNECGQRVWVPEVRLGDRGQCPACSHVMDTPDYVPDYQLVAGPPIIEPVVEESQLVGMRE